MCDFERHVNFVIFKFDTGVDVFVHSLKLGVNVYIFIFFALSLWVFYSLCLCTWSFHLFMPQEDLSVYVYILSKQESHFKLTIFGYYLLGKYIKMGIRNSLSRMGNIISLKPED